MAHEVSLGQRSPDPAINVTTGDQGPGLRIRNGGSGNSIEVLGKGDSVLWSVDSSGNPSSGGGGGVSPATMLPAPNGTDDTTAIQTVLSNGGSIAGRPGASYIISAPLVIPSNTTLNMTSCTITLKAGSNCQLLVNNAFNVGSGRDNNITVFGGVWDKGANGGSGMGLDCIVMQRVDFLGLRDMKVTSTNGKYAFNIYACTKFEVGRITLATSSDGVHISSSSTQGYIHDIWGTAGDDVVALTPVDFSAHQNGDFGDITDIRIEGVYATTTANGVKILSGFDGTNPRNVYRVWVKNVAGSFGANAVLIGGDATQVSTYGGSIFNVEVDGAINTGAGGCLYFYGVGPGQIVDGIVLKRLYATVGSTIQVYSSSIVNPIGTIIVKDSYFVQGISINSNGANTATVKQLVVEDCHFNLGAGLYAVSMVGTGTTCESISIKNCLIEHSTNSGGTVQVNGTTNICRDIFLSDITINQNAWSVGDIGGSISVNLYAVNINNRGGGGNIINLRAGATLTIKRLDGIVGGTTIANAGSLTWTNYSINGTTTTTAPGAGAAGALPATPAGYLTVSIDGTNHQIPYY